MYISENVSACQNGLTSLARGIFARFFLLLSRLSSSVMKYGTFYSHFVTLTKTNKVTLGQNFIFGPKSQCWGNWDYFIRIQRRSRVILLVAAIQSWATRRSVMDYFPVIITKNAKQRRQAWLWSFVGWPWHSAFLRSRPILLTVEEEEGLPSSSSWQLQSLTQFPLWTIYRNPFFFYHNCRWTRRTWTIIISIKRW